MKTTLEQWRMFRAVVETGSFAKAVPIATSPATPSGFPAEKLTQIEFVAVAATNHELAENVLS